MREAKSKSVGSGWQSIIQCESEKVDGARLIAPSIPCGKLPSYSLGIEKGLKDGFRMALEGAYPVCNPVLDLENQVVYSVDMVRLDFWHENQQKLIDAVDKNMVFATHETFTSNRIGTYRFMWTFRFADGEHGGYRITDENGEIVEDGNEKVVFKCGFGVVGKGGACNKKGFVEFNPNKCEENARKFISYLSDMGCLFELNRYDVAVDFSIDRNAVRVLRDRRTYEYIISSKGGATEYLGTRNAPGRVKVYDKAGEQGLEIDLTRVELTCKATWNVKEIIEHMPICNDYAAFQGDSSFLAICTLIGDFLTGVGDDGKPVMKPFNVVPERYLNILKKNTRYKLKKALKRSKKVIEFDGRCLEHCRKRAMTFAC